MSNIINKVKNLRPLRVPFYCRNTVEVARELLGKILVKQVRRDCVSGIIVEDEAYSGKYDPASHAYRGPTPRSKLMFGRAGFSYIFLIHGNHYCFNVTTEKEGTPGAVLIRSIEPLNGIEIMRQNRNMKYGDLTELTNGPGKLTKAMGINMAHNGIDLTLGKEIFLAESSAKELFNVVSSPRIGIKKGTDKLWRFYIEDNRFVSRSQARVWVNTNET